MAKKVVKPKIVKAAVSHPSKAHPSKVHPSKVGQATAILPPAATVAAVPANAGGASAAVLDRLWSVVTQRRDADPALSHSARLLSRGTAKVAQKFGEEAVECLIEAVAGNTQALVAESADVLYHLLVLWVNAGVEPQTVWAELERREGVSGIAEKAARPRPVLASGGTRKIP
jgi:phosphoribosyl-ATP pyrophosphohydrolase